MKGLLGILLIKVVIGILLTIGWIMCIVKAVKCNWEPVGKAEVVYTIGIFAPPVGGVVGWFNIEDK